MSLKVIITAAGMGSRLGHHTDDVPKCMIPVGDRPILHRALDLFRAQGLDDAVVVGGWHHEKLQADQIRRVVNDDYANNNILKSLFYARDEMANGFLFSYSDIVFEEDIVKKLLESTGDFAVVGDEDWRGIYEGRDEHPLSEAELIDLDDSGRILELGKHLKDEPHRVEFIGMMRVSASGAQRLKIEYERLESLVRAGGPNPFPRAKSFEQAYITDMMSYLIRQGESVELCRIHGGWREIDTPQDLQRAKELYRSS